MTKYCTTAVLISIISPNSTNPANEKEETCQHQTLEGEENVGEGPEIVEMRLRILKESMYGHLYI